MTKIVKENISKTISSSFINYAMSVIISRAIPDLKDGLKPVQRRIIYAMFKGGYVYSGSFFKCARVVGEVMGKYHPHGDSSIYDSLVRIAQSWMMREILIVGKGNIGSPGIDEPAAMRYTECKLSKLSNYFVESLNEETVEMQPNYDSKLQEPTIFPARFPNLLINGAYGVAVGMLTNIPPHNPAEIYEAIKYYVSSYRNLSNEELEDGILEIVKGPDFPNGSTVGSSTEIKKMYRTGAGEFLIRGDLEIEEVGNNSHIAITSLPYRINIDQFIERLSSIKSEGKLLNDISSIKDVSSLKTGTRIIITPKRGKDVKSIISQLYLYTQLQTKYHAKFLAIYNGKPQTFSLLQIIKRWVEFQIEIISKRSVFRLKNVRRRLHLLVGLIKGIENIDRVVAIIKRSSSTDVAKVTLIREIKIDDIQATAILNMSLKRLTAMEVKTLREEFAKLKDDEKYLVALIESRGKQEKLFLREFGKIIEITDSARRTKIDESINKRIDIESTIVNKKLVLIFTSLGYIKLMDLNNYRVQKRGGVGLKYIKLHETDTIKQVLTLNNKDWVLFFTSSGHVYRIKAYELRESESRESKGFHVSSLVELKESDSIVNIIAIANYSCKDYLMFATKDGLLKKTPLQEYNSHTKLLIAINLYDNDKLQALTLCNDDDEIILMSRNGRTKRFSAENIPKRNRSAIGVIGIKFRGDDKLLTMHGLLRDGNMKDRYMLTVTKNGYVKKTPIEEYPTIISRISIGVTGCNLTEKTGALIGALIVNDNDHIISITNTSDLLMTNIGDINPTQRRTSGVQLMKLRKNSYIIDITTASVNT